MDLSKYNDQDYEQLKRGNIQGMSDAGYQEYKTQSQQYSGAKQQASNPQTTPDSADKAAHPNQPTIPQGQPSDLKSYLDKLTQPSDPRLRHPDYMPVVAGNIPMAPELVSSAARRIGLNTLLGGAQGALQDPQEGQSRLGNAATGAVVGGGISAGLEGVAGAAGSGADKLMQWATDMRKNNPGVGTSLIDQGIWGTKAGMASQVDSKLAQEEDNLQQTVSSLKGTVNSKEIADAVGNKAKQFTLPSTGQGSPFSQGELDKVRGMSDNLSKIGDLSAPDLLALKRQGDYQGYTASGNPATSTEASMGRAGANAAREALKNMSPEAADSLMKERALILAQKGLDKPDTIHQGVGSSLFFGKVPGSSLAGSMAAQGLQGLVANPASTAASPSALQGLFGTVRQNAQTDQK